MSGQPPGPQPPHYSLPVPQPPPELNLRKLWASLLLPPGVCLFAMLLLLLAVSSMRTPQPDVIYAIIFLMAISSLTFL